MRRSAVEHTLDSVVRRGRLLATVVILLGATATGGAALAAGITVSPTSGLGTTEAGGTAQFTVVLDTQPTDDVTIGIATSNGAEGAPSTASLTFTPGNWDVPQTVTVTGADDPVDDADVGYSILTAAATSNDVDYNGLDPADVSVTNADNDTAGITVIPTSGLVTSETGTSDQFTVVLDSQPTADVTIGLSSSDTGEGTVAPTSLTFTSGNWSSAQTVTVTGVDDAALDGNVAYTVVTAAASSGDPNYNNVNPANISVTNNDNEVAGFSVVPTSGLVTTEGGGTAQFSITLTAQPSANVTVGISSSDTGEGTVSTTSLNFTSGNWNSPHTVTVTGVDDAIVDGDVAFTILTAAATSGDPNYNGVNPPNVSVTNNDNDTAGITVTPTSGLVTTEAGGTAQFTIVLTSQPSANVTIGLSSSDLGEGSVAPASVTFTSANWSVAQTVTVTGQDDATVDGNVAYTITTAAATSTDPGYAGTNPADVSVTNNDDDAAAITVTPTAGLVTTEAGGTAQFTIVLTSQPGADVTVGLSSSDVGEGTVAPTSVTFSPGDWSVVQTVTVTGVDDAVVDGNMGYTITTAAATSSDPNYNGVNPANVSVTNNDNDAAGITVTPTAGLVTTEAGGTAQFTIVLTSQPSANVTIGLSSSDVGEGTVAPASATFTPANWSVAQTVTVTGVNDALADGNVAYTINTAAATSADPSYNGMNPANVSVTNTDDDVAGITVTPTAGLVTTEAGGTAQFTIVLTSQPTANVTIGLTSSDATEGTVAPASVTFTSANWSVAQTVTVTGVNDAVMDGNVAYTVNTAAATSADPGYSGRNAPNVSVTNNDNDVAGITVNPTAGLVTTEAGGTAQFTIVLTSQPTANVTIGLSSSDPGEGTVAPASVTFTAVNWGTAQTVTVTGVNDAIIDGNVAYTINTAAATSPDPNYGGMNAANVSVTNNDNDAAGITVSPTAGLVTTEAGGTAQFTMVLTSQPNANVTVGVVSSDLSEGTAVPASVTFTSANWNVAQAVTVTGVDDFLNDGNVAYTVITAAAVSTDLNYGGLDPANVSVTNNDNDAAGVTVNPTAGLVTTEAGGTAQFTIVLTSQPGANVTIGLSSSDLTEGTVAPASVTFTSANWNVTQVVTVTGVDDAIADGSVAYTILTAAATSADPDYNGVNPTNVGVSNSDNDAAGITVNPAAGLVTTEAGGSAQFTVVLNSQPTANVTIGLSSSDLTEGTVAPASLTFTAVNWSTAQTVTVTGVDDPTVDGNVAYSIQTAAATSGDPNYNGVNAANVGVTNSDNDAAGITVNPTAGLTTTEVGGTAQFTIVLTSQPSANVTVGLSSSDLTEGTVAPASVTFTPGNWNTPQTVTTTGVDDFLNDGNVAFSIVTVTATSTDPNYNGLDAANVSVTNSDNDAPGVTVNPTAGLVTTEAGGTATFTVVLTSQPTADVTIGLSSSDLTEGTVAPAGLTFTPATWSTLQTVTVTGVDDPAVDGSVAYAVQTASAASADADYNGLDPANVAVTNSDNDAAGITVNPTAGLVTSEAGATAEFTIVLTSQPSANVTIGLSSSDLTEGTVTPTSMTFTPANWSVAQTATVTGVDDFLSDGSVAYTIQTAAATSVDPAYNGLNPANVAVTNNDNDATGISVSAINGNTTESGGAATFTVVLASQPTANVTIGLSSSDLTEGTVAPASLTFTSANWSAAQTVTVTGVDDPLVDGAVAYTIVTAAAVSTDPGYNGTNPADVAVTNNDNDVAAISVNPTAGLITNEAGGTATFTVVLNTQPSANVTFPVNSSDATEGTIVPASLTFTPVNWNVPQTVVVTGVDDFLDDGNVNYSAFVLPGTSLDPGYNGLNPPNPSLTNLDDDAAGITVTPTAGLVTTEAGATATFTVVLTSQPTANVTMGLSSSDVSEGTVAPASLTFTAANWNVPQTVTVTGVDDPMVDGAIAYSIVTAAATSSDNGYSGRNAADVTVTNNDNDTAGFAVVPTAGLVTTESGGTAEFTVALTSQPSADVTLGLTSTDLTEGTVAPAGLTFTPASWNVAQTVTVTGVDDPGVDGAIAYTIVTSVAASADANYNGLNPANVAVTNSDNDAAGITVNPTAGLVTTEAGGTAKFTIVLNTQPVADVTIGLSSNDLTEGTVAPANFTFTAANWNVPQTATMTGVDDPFVDGPVAYTIVTGLAVSADANYSGLNPANVSATNTDNDTAGITVTPTAGLTTSEAGGTAQFTVVLTSQPSANVSIGLSTSDPTEGTVAPASLTFNGSNWNTPRTVTVTGVDDPVVDGAIVYSIITAAATSGDAHYNGLNPADVAATNTDNDVAGITVTPTAGLVTTEAGGTAQFTVVLTSQPAANVTVGLMSSDVTEGQVAQPDVMFTPADWNVAKAVIITGVDDLVDDGNVGYTITTSAASSTDPLYNGLNPANVSVTNTDNDAAGITVTPTAGLVTTEAGGTAQFTVVLNSQPTANVTIGLSSNDPSEGTVAPASLVFTPADWNLAQTVTVIGVDDLVDDGNIAYTIVTATATSPDGGYNGINPPNVGVSNTDDDAAGITVTPTAGLVTSEAGGTAQFTIVLDSQPTGSVTIALASNDPGEGSVAPASLTFTAADWSVAQTVTVTGVDDPAVDGDAAYAIVTAAASSADANYNGRDPADVAVSNADDDVAGISITPVAGLVTTEAGGAAHFNVVLTSQPAADVTFTLASADPSEGTVTPTSLTFTPATWNVPSIVTVTGVDDFLDDGDAAYLIVTQPATSADPAYDGVDPADVAAVNQDDDEGATIRLDLIADRDRVEPGQPVRYTLAIRNPTKLMVAGLEIQHALPPRFGYLAGSAARDGRAIPDPAGAGVQRFPLDTLAAFVDLNGDGVPGPGEPGYLALSWTLAPGATATTGSYTNSAVAVATAACSSCVVSNRAEATVRLDEDGIFARGTVVGRVFEDSDRDGRLGAGERGVGGAVVALDDGTRVSTDAEGRFHLPDLDAGPRVVKLDVGALGIPATPTTDVTQVLNVSPGLMASTRFGVWFMRDTVTIGSPPAEGLAIITDELEHAVHIAGNAFRAAVIVNGRPVSVRSVDVRLNPEGSDELVRLAGDSLETAAVFQTELGDTSGVARWWLEIRGSRAEVVHIIEGDGVPPARLRWNGRPDGVRRLKGGEVYSYQLNATYTDGDVIQGPRRLFGADRWTSIAATLGSDAFPGDGVALSLGAKTTLARLGAEMRRSPREVVVIEGHTDSVGNSEASRLLSRRRAEAVLDHLITRERIQRGRLVVEAYGGARPVASNGTESGRDLNRRVEIYGMATEVKRARLFDVTYRKASARVGTVDVPVDSAGRFAIELPVAGHDTIEVALVNRRGRVGIARMRMPSLALEVPRGELRLRFGESADGVRVEPRAALEAESEPMASLVATPAEKTVAHVRLRGRTDPGNRAEVDGRPVEVGADGRFSTELPLHVGENAFAIVARDRRGTQRLSSLLVRVLDRGPDGRNLLAIARIPDLTVQLPPPGTVLAAPEVRLSGQTRPGYRVLANQDTLLVNADGTFSGRTSLPEGKSMLKVTVVDSAGNHGVVEREIEVQSKRLFLVGLADGVVGRMRGEGFVSSNGGSATWTEGRIAYQLKGWIAGRYLVQSAFDSRRREFGSLFRDLDDAGRDRLLVNLDTDRFYPVYGDSSVVTYGSPGGGRFFLAVESDLVRASVGDFPIAFDEVELASFHRTLYGAQVRVATPTPASLGSAPDTGPVAAKSSLALFGAQARQVHIRDAIRATGGTLYYLSHGEAIEGSVQVALVVNDKDTGLPLRRIPLQRGLDYTAKELEGRLMFARPVASVWDDGSLVGGEPLSGHPVTIEVDYETRGSVGEKAAVGGRVRQAVGRFVLGATVVDDQAGTGDYQLRGGDVAVRLGDRSHLGFELAGSEGRAGHVFASDNGGVGYVPADTGGVRSGNAWKATAELAPGEWMPRADRMRLGLYVRRIDSGFATQDRTTGEALDQFGVRGQFDAGTWGMWSARYDQDLRGETDSTAGRTRDVLGLHWHRDGRRIGVATEFEQRSLSGWGVADSSGSSLAGQLWWSPVARIRASLERRQSLSGPDQHRTALGLQWQVHPRLTLGARGSDGATGSELRGDATLTMGQRSAYLREERLDEFGRRRSGTVLGVQAPLGAMGRTYSEYQWQRDAAGERALSVLGVEQGWRAADGLTLRVAGEHGNRAGVPGMVPTGGLPVGAAPGQRTTVSSDLTYRGRFPVSGFTRGEYRVETGALRQEQFLTSTRIEWSLLAGFSLRGDYRLSVTRQPALGLTPARFEESSLGLAWRPMRSDRVQALARWTRLDDRRRLAPTDSISSAGGIDVAALEATVRVTPELEWSGKGAARILYDGHEGLPTVATHGSLWISRLDYAFMRPMRLGVEYRLLAQRETSDQRHGWLNELSWDPAAHFRLGLGYNFTRFSGDLLDRNQENAQGWFIRAQSRY